jgi:hypothetical protein
VNSLERYCDALASVVARFARGEVCRSSCSTAYNAAHPHGSERIAREMIVAEPLSLDAGETTDKGYTNQRRVLERPRRRGRFAHVRVAIARPLARAAEQRRPMSRRKCGAIWLERAMVAARAPPHPPHDPSRTAPPHRRPCPVRGTAMPALHRCRRHRAISTPSGPRSDIRSMPKPPSKLSLRARRRGTELAVEELAVEERGGPAIAAVAVLAAAAAAVVVLLRWLS